MSTPTNIVAFRAAKAQKQLDDAEELGQAAPDSAEAELRDAAAVAAALIAQMQILATFDEAAAKAEKPAEVSSLAAFKKGGLSIKRPAPTEPQPANVEALATRRPGQKPPQ